MHLWIVINTALAEPIAIYANEEIFGSTKQIELQENTEKILWQDLQKTPLTFYGVSPEGGCVSVGKKNTEITKSLDKVVDLLSYVELNKALGHINRIENDFLCLEEVAPAVVLSRSYYLSGVTYYYKEDLEKATEKWQQALAFYPEAGWDEQIEPSGKPLFLELQSDLEATAFAQLSMYPSEVSVTVDGKSRRTGENIPAGRHLVQYQQQKMINNWISVDPGGNVTLVALDAFDSNVENVLADEQAREELLTSLQLVRPDAEIKVIGADTVWYVPKGSSSWSQGTVEDFLPKVQRNTRKALLISSAASLALGGTSFLLAKQSHDNYLAEGNAAQAETYYAMNKVWFWGGVALSTGAGGLMVGGLMQR